MKPKLPEIDSTFTRIRDGLTVRVIDAVGGMYGYVRLRRTDAGGPAYNVRLVDFPAKYRAEPLGAKS